jgi:hypothetical protein
MCFRLDWIIYFILYLAYTSQDPPYVGLRSIQKKIEEGLIQPNLVKNYGQSKIKHE